MEGMASPRVSQLAFVAQQPVPWPSGCSFQVGASKPELYSTGGGRSELASMDLIGTLACRCGHFALFCTAASQPGQHEDSSISDSSTVHEKSQERHLSFSGGSRLTSSVASSAYPIGE